MRDRRSSIYSNIDSNYYILSTLTNQARHIPLTNCYDEDDNYNNIFCIEKESNNRQDMKVRSRQEGNIKMSDPIKHWLRHRKNDDYPHRIDKSNIKYDRQGKDYTFNIEDDFNRHGSYDFEGIPVLSQQVKTEDKSESYSPLKIKPVTPLRSTRNRSNDLSDNINLTSNDKSEINMVNYGIKTQSVLDNQENDYVVIHPVKPIRSRTSKLNISRTSNSHPIRYSNDDNKYNDNKYNAEEHSMKEIPMALYSVTNTNNENIKEINKIRGLNGPSNSPLEQISIEYQLSNILSSRNDDSDDDNPTDVLSLIMENGDYSQQETPSNIKGDIKQTEDLFNTAEVKTNSNKDTLNQYKKMSPLEVQTVENQSSIVNSPSWFEEILSYRKDPSKNNEDLYNVDNSTSKVNSNTPSNVSNNSNSRNTTRDFYNYYNESEQVNRSKIREVQPIQKSTRPLKSILKPPRSSHSDPIYMVESNLRDSLSNTENKYNDQRNSSDEMKIDMKLESKTDLYDNIIAMLNTS